LKALTPEGKVPMNLSPEERQRIYEEEKARLEARENLRPKRGHPFLVGCFVVIVAFFVLAAILGSRHSPPSETPSAPTSQPARSDWILTAQFHYNEARVFAHFDPQLRPYTYNTLADCQEDKALREAVLRAHPDPVFHTVPVEKVYGCEWAPADMAPNPWHGQK
jgi:hypothetical protein